MIDVVKSTLKDNNLRITAARVAVANVLLENSKQFMSSHDIYDYMSERDQECDQVSVYRTLNQFEKIGLVKKSQFQGEAACFQIDLDNNHKSHHQHFFKCVKCSIVEPIKGCFVRQSEKDLLDKGYKSLHHHLEIVGVCPSCQ